MQVTVFGANGNVGRLVVKELLVRGHSVVAFVHKHSALPDHDGLLIQRGDVRNPDDVAGAVKGSQAVISALGSWRSRRQDVLTAGMTTIIPAMEQAGVSRIITVTGADARSQGDRLGIIHRISHSLELLAVPRILRDGERHIGLLRDSNLDWTALRSPIMTGKTSGKYKLDAHARPLPWATISRQAVVTAMADMLEVDTYIRQAPYISRS